MHFRAQVAVEFLIVVIMLLVVVSSIFSYAVYISQVHIHFEKAKTSAKTLSNAANAVYGLGPGTRIVVEIDVPGGVQSTIIGKKAVGWKVSFFGSTGDVFAETDATVVGSIPTAEGRQRAVVTMEESGVVRMGALGLDIKPETVYALVHPGGTKTVDMNAINGTGASLTGVQSRVTGQAAGFITVSGLSPSISADANDAFQLSISTPANNAAGIFEATLDVNSNQAYNDVSAITVEVLHVLKDLNIWLFGDEFYSSHKTIFFPGQAVYYEARFFDQTMSLFDVRDLNVRVKDNVGATVQSSLNQSSANGKYQSSYTLPCTAASGTWSVNADANANNTVSDLNSFTVSSAQQQANFGFDWNSASFDPSNKRLENWTIKNIADCQTLAITKMKVTWINDNDNATLEKIRLSNNTVWTGTATSGTLLDLSPTFNVPALTSYSSDNKLEFSQVINDDAETFRIEFTFSDNSTFTTTIYP